VNVSAFSLSKKQPLPDPHHYLKKGTGLGGTLVSQRRRRMMITVTMMVVVVTMMMMMMVLVLVVVVVVTMMMMIVGSTEFSQQASLSDSWLCPPDL
jgi:hypothetical protein